MLYDPEILFLGIYPKEMKSLVPVAQLVSAWYLYNGNEIGILKR
jgi:hypothetical protein